MSNTPNDAELGKLAEECGIGWAAGLGGMSDFLSAFARAVLARWGTPQPVVREPLSDAQIAEMMLGTWGCASIAPRHALEFARAVEAEVRKQDEALIRQTLEALEQSNATLWEEDDDPSRPAHQAITAARARLGEKT